MLPAKLLSDFNEFKSVPPWIFRVAPPSARKVVVLDDFHAASAKNLAQFVQVEHRKGRVRLLCRLKISVHPDVQLLRTALKPAAPAGPQDGRLFNLFHAQECAVEFLRRGFASLGRRDLNVIDPRHA